MESPSMEPPSSKAKPKQVRAYLANILIHKHDVSPEAAEIMVNRWQLGLGRDLRQATENDFVKLFGKTVGLYLYRSVEDDLYAAWRSSTEGTINYYALGTACVAAIFFLACARCSFPDRQQVAKYMRCALFCGPIILIGSVREVAHWNNAFFIALLLVGGLMTIFAFIFLVAG